jgi:hypothetical protein
MLQQSRRHANSDLTAQEELLVCLGSILKQKLQDYWRTTKSEEVVRVRTQQLICQVFLKQISDFLAHSTSGINLNLNTQNCEDENLNNFTENLPGEKVFKKEPKPNFEEIVDKLRKDVKNLKTKFQTTTSSSSPPVSSVEDQHNQQDTLFTSKLPVKNSEILDFLVEAPPAESGKIFEKICEHHLSSPPSFTITDLDEIIEERLRFKIFGNFVSEKKVKNFEKNGDFLLSKPPRENGYHFDYEDDDHFDGLECGFFTRFECIVTSSPLVSSVFFQ